MSEYKQQLLVADALLFAARLEGQTDPALALVLSSTHPELLQEIAITVAANHGRRSLRAVEDFCEAVRVRSVHAAG